MENPSENIENAITFVELAKSPQCCPFLVFLAAQMLGYENISEGTMGYEAGLGYGLWGFTGLWVIDVDLAGTKVVDRKMNGLPRCMGF